MDYSQRGVSVPDVEANNEEWESEAVRGAELRIRGRAKGELCVDEDYLEEIVAVLGLAEARTTWLVEHVDCFLDSWFSEPSPKSWTVWFRRVLGLKCMLTDVRKVVVDSPAGFSYIVWSVAREFYKFEASKSRMAWTLDLKENRIQMEAVKTEDPLGEEVYLVEIQTIGRGGRRGTLRVWKRAFDVIRRLSLHDRESGLRRFQRETGFFLDAFAVKLFEDTLRWSEAFFPKV